MRKAILGFALGFILSATPVPCAQEHAPTVDVCRADRALWENIEQRTDYFTQETKLITDGIRNTNPIAKLSFREITLRSAEMGACQSVDASSSHSYYEMMNFYQSVISDRYHRFIMRHHLMGQFKTEDAAGTR